MAHSLGEVADEVLFSYNPGTGGYTFSRGSAASFRDVDRVLQEAASGVLRDGHYVENENGDLVRSTRLEAARTNELHNSDSPATQTRNLTAGTYTLWMEGSGSVDASGATDGSYGTATEGQSNDLTFTVSADQDVTFTVNGTATRFQCEAGSFRSSFISTGSSAVSRAADHLTFPISFGPQGMSIYAKARFSRIEGSAVTGTIRVGRSQGSGTVALGLDQWPTTGWRAYLDDEDGTFHDAQASGSVEFGDIVEHEVVWDKAASTLIHRYSRNGGSVSEATTSGIGGGDTFRSQQVHFRREMDLISFVIAPGVRTMDEMRSLAGVN